VPGLGEPGRTSKLQVSVGYKYARATKSYFNSRYNRDFTHLWAPFERQSSVDVAVRYVVNRRVNVVLDIPVVFNNFSMLFPPEGPGVFPGDGGARSGFNANGLGDVSIYGQSFIFDPLKHPLFNIALGFGLKPPTGRWNTTGLLPDETGEVFANRTLYPPAIQPGDGGLGLIFGFDAYKTFRRASRFLNGDTVYMSGSYMASTRNTNGAASIISGLGVLPVAPIFSNELVNSVPDSYTGKLGIMMKLPFVRDNPKLKGVRFTAALHVEGVTDRNLITKSDGWRQPGYAFSAAPGLIIPRGRGSWIVEIPITWHRYINANKTLLPIVQDSDSTASGYMAGALNPHVQLGMVPQVAVTCRYVRAF
jgi:hypothetical protein